MKRYTTTILAAILVTALLGVGCASSQSAGTRVDDAAITAKIKTKLTADPEINPFNIDVDTEAGVVRLSGTVDDRTTRREAVELAQRTDGVVRVVNEITVGEKTLAESVDDAAIVAKVKTKLSADPEVNPFTIDVDSAKGVVTLSGKVNTQAQKDEAGELAKSVKGVTHVHNRLNVSP